MNLQRPTQNNTGHVNVFIRSCSEWGLPSRLITQPLVRSYRTVSSLPFGGLFSVALSLGLPPLAVSQHPALWSPDFPQLAPRSLPANAVHYTAPLIKKQGLIYYSLVSAINFDHSSIAFASSATLISRTLPLR